MRNDFEMTGDGEKKPQPVGDPQELLARGRRRPFRRCSRFLTSARG